MLNYTLAASFLAEAGVVVRIKVKMWSRILYFSYEYCTKRLQKICVPAPIALSNIYRLMYWTLYGDLSN